MIWTIVIGILLVFLGWLLFAPIFLNINTSEKEYSAGLKGLLNLSIKPDKEHLFYIRISILFYAFNIFPLKKKEKKPKATTKVKKPKKKKKKTGFRTIWLIVKIAWKVLGSFRLKKLYLNIDTENITTNAYLIPVFANLHRNNINLNVNYTGDFGVIINIKNNIFRILVVSLKTYLHHKKIL